MDCPDINKIRNLANQGRKIRHISTILSLCDYIDFLKAEREKDKKAYEELKKALPSQ